MNFYRFVRKKIIVTRFTNFRFNKIQPKLQAHQSKSNKWKIIKLDYKWNIPIESCTNAHSNLDNGRKTQHKITGRVVPHYID
jgi:hypothetical protein